MKYLGKVSPWVLGALAVITLAGVADEAYDIWVSRKGIEPAAVLEQIPREEYKGRIISQNAFPIQPAARKKLEIVDKSMGYYIEGDMVIAPVPPVSSDDDIYISEKGKTYAVPFKHVVGIGDFDGFSVRTNEDVFYGMHGDIISVRLSSGEYEDLLDGRRACSTVTMIPKEEDGRKKPGYIACFELSKKGKRLALKSE